MAVPSALKKLREQLKQEEPVAQVVMPEPEPEPVVLQEEELALETYSEKLTNLTEKLADAATPEEVSNARSEITSLKDKYSSLSGRLQAESRRANSAEAKLQLNEDNIRSYEARIAAAELERDDLLSKQREAERKTKLSSLDDIDEISDAELNEFDPKDIRMVRGLTKKQLVPVLKTLMTEVDELKSQLSGMQNVSQQVSEIGKSHQAIAQQAAAQVEREYFSKALGTSVPNWESIVKTPEWKAFLAKPDGDDPDVKKGHTLSHYRRSKFVPGIVATFKEFMLSNGNTGMASLATPEKTYADKAIAVKQKIKSSEYVKNLQAYTKSKSMDKATWEKFKASFNQARQNGMVDDDARIFNH